MINENVAGEGLTQDGTGALTVNYEVVKDKIKKGKVSSESIVVTGGDSATFKDVSLEVKAGKAGEVLSTVSTPGTDENGNPITIETVQWTTADKVNVSHDLVKNTVSGQGTNNTLVSTVNGSEKMVQLVDAVSNTIEGTSLKTMVNGIASEGIDLTSPVQAAQKTTSVEAGSTKVTVVDAQVGKNTKYTVDVVEANLNLASVGGVLNANQLAPGTDGQVLSTVTVEGKEVTQWITPASQLKYDVKGIDGVKVTPAEEAGTKTYTVQVEAAMPKVFYMPPVVFNTKKTGKGERDLYQEYVEMFTRTDSSTGTIKDMPSLPAIVKSNTDVNIPVYQRHQLDFFVVYYDQGVFSEVKFNETGKAKGVLTYSIVKQATHGSFMTIVMVYNGKEKIGK